MSENLYPRGIEVIVGPYIINDKHEVLLFQSPKWKGQWTICGGHVDPGETLENALKREVREEIGVEIEIIETINIGEFITSPPEFKRNAHFVYIDSIAKLKSEDFKFNDEISASRWFNISEALKMPDIHDSCKKGILKVQKWLENQNK